jgi:hypothetical protein
MPFSYATVFRFTSIHFVSSAILEQFETVDQAVDLIASAPCLEGIKLVCTHCFGSRNPSHLSQAIAPPLRRIWYEANNSTEYIMDWFCRCHPTPSVHTLEIDQLSSNDNVSTACKFIRLLGSALENLTISCIEIPFRSSKYISDPYCKFNKFYQLP